MLQGVIKAKDKCKPDKVRIQIGGIYSVLRGNDKTLGQEQDFFFR